MDHSPTMSRSRALVGVIAVALALLLTACLSGGQERTIYLTNRDRAAYGRAALAVDGQLLAKAEIWAAKMARDGRIAHSSLTSGAPGCWRSLGENVGVASSPDRLHQAWMASSSHRANILNGVFTHVGVGIVERGGRYYGVQVFMRAC